MSKHFDPKDLEEILENYEEHFPTKDIDPRKFLPMLVDSLRHIEGRLRALEVAAGLRPASK